MNEITGLIFFILLALACTMVAIQITIALGNFIQWAAWKIYLLVDKITEARK